MTAAADRQHLADWKAGRLDTREKMLLAHVGTIDRLDELEGFVAQTKANGRWTNEINVAVLRRQMQIGEK